MNMTYGAILNRHAFLISVGEMRLPRKATVAIVRNITKFEKELNVYNEQRKDIAERYAAKDEKGEFILDGNNHTFDTPENEAAFLQEVNELNETEVDVDVMTFKASELDRCEEIERYDIPTPLQEAGMAWMIDYEE